jgi:uncharacterized membrane protein
MYRHDWTFDLSDALSGTSLVRAACLAVLVAATLASGCSGSDGDTGSATVEISSISPQTTYPGVETEIEFSITPKSGVSADDISWRVDFGDRTNRSGEGTEGSVTYAWESSGQYTVEVSALSGGDQIGSATDTVRVSTPLQLSVSEIRPNPSNVEAGGQLQVLFDIVNASPTAVESPFDVAVYLTQETSVTLEDVDDLNQIGTGTVKSSSGPVIRGSETRTVDVQAEIPSDTEAGEYQLVAWLNPEGDIANQNPENGIGVSNRVVRVSSEEGIRPDIEVRDVYTRSDRAYPTLNKLSRGFTLENSGGGEAFDVETTTYLSVGDAQLDDSDTKIQQSESSRDIPAGESVEVGPEQIVLDEDITAEDGDKEVYVIVEATQTSDADDPELSNNVSASEPPIVVSNELVNGPDIAVDEFSVSPQNTYLDGSLQVSMTVANQGTADVGSFICGLYLGQEQRIDTGTDARFSSISITDLPSEASEEIDRTVTVPAIHDPGTYYIYTVCDPNGGLEESYRNNNREIHPDPVEVTEEADVDLFVDQLQVPEQVSEGNELELTATACVNGSNPSGQRVGELYMTTGTQVDFDEEPVSTFDVPNIVPGECRDIDISMTASCEDFEQNYAFGVIVDANENLPEQNEDNNEARGSNPVQIQGEYCQCTEDAYETESDSYRDAPSVGEGQYSASICEAGSCDYFAVPVDPGESLVVDTEYDHDKGPLETTLQYSGGSQAIDSADTPGRQRVAAYNVPSQNRYIVKVCAGNSSARNLYDLNIDILPKKTGVDLIPERVELPSQESFSIGAEIDANLTVHNIGDTDSPGFDLGLVLSPNRTVGDGNDVPLDPASVAVDPVSGGGSSTVSARVELPTSVNAGEYYILAEVDPTGALNETTTSNNVSASRPLDIEVECYDPLEPNDSLSTASSIDEGSYTSLVACAQSDDYYELCVNDNEKFTVTTNFTPQDGDIDMELFDQHGNIVDSSGQTGASQEDVSVDYVNGDQCYYVHTFLQTNQQSLETNYEMSVDVQNVAPNLQCDSHFEPNNAFSTASSFVTATQQTNKLDRCPASDTDYYRLDLERGQQVTLRANLEPSSQPGSLTLQLYKPNQQPTRNSSTAPGIPVAEIDDYIAPTAGTYFAQVTVSGSTRRITYTLEEEGLEGIDLSAANLWFWQGEYEGGDTLQYQFDLSNKRADTATSPSYSVYLGDSSTHDPSSDTKLTTETHSDLPGNTTDTINAQVQLPSSVPSGTTRYIHVKAESDASQSDPISSNNVASLAIDFK